MVRIDGETQKVIDREIKTRMEAIREHPIQIQRRIIELQLQPNETIASIKQIDGLLIEIHKETLRSLDGA